ncbi:hypothetical protein QYH69_35005 [Paraburkholderia sp. SARCC-3016]|uniref:hypothetical protein n=1 Tax=Paraburkholderia sp. SARCC-3016 TaxID=3058611 RepID=UPI002808D3C9|nr:hypothetical protein [Paraburkholderia sp. SARCC-3016]MDQ7982427.1 hypothetical protein [Paraburkholderia sp. SARCC-3016]
MPSSFPSVSLAPPTHTAETRDIASVPCAGNRTGKQAEAAPAWFSGLKSHRSSEGNSSDVADTASATSWRLRRSSLPSHRSGLPGPSLAHGECQSIERSRMHSETHGASAASSINEDDEITLEMPPPCGGALTVCSDGKPICKEDRGVQSVLNLIGELDLEAVRNLNIAPGAQIHIEWDEQLMEKMNSFRQLSGGNMLMTTDLLRDAIAKGESAFTPEARMPGTDQHPSTFLRNVGIQIRVTPDNGASARLQAVLIQQSNDPAKQARLAKFRGDFGAMSMLSLATNKDFNKELAYGLCASLVGTGVIGASFDYGIWASVKTAIGPAAAAKYGPLLDSLTPLFAETFDSMVIKRLMEAMKGNTFMPAHLSEALGDLKGAAFSGSIAAVGSLPNNFVRDLAKAANDSGHELLAVCLLVAKQVTNLLATWTSGAMVPLEVMADHRELVDRKLAMIEAGTIPCPQVDDVLKHVSDEALSTLRAARGTGSAIRSMATGGEIAATLGLMLSLLSYAGILPSTVEQLITLMYSTPTEVISMVSTMAAEKWVGADSSREDARITTDAAKQSGMLGQIAKSDQTSLADLDHIARPYGERNAQLGYAVTVALSGAMGLVEKGAEYGVRYAGAVGRGVQVLPGTAYEHGLKPVGQGIAQTAQKAGEALAPVLTPAGKAMLAGAAAAGTYVVKPTANATAMAVDGVVRASGASARLVGQAASSGADAVSRLVRSRARGSTAEQNGDDMA